jgi:Ca2+/H+ antiporter, TMEM165/GDT1 family
VDLLVMAVAFGTIFVVELPDKTFLATLVLSTKYRPLFVWIGVGLAFALQTLIAVALGKAAALLPQELVQGVAAVLFLVGAVLLIREARADPEDDDAEELSDKAREATGFRAIGASFLVLFAAEWGDLSQVLTLSLVARYDDPVSVYVGALGALLLVSGLAVIAGRTLVRFIPIHVLHYIGAAVCLVLASITTYELIR